jgi:hypothetical protein
MFHLFSFILVREQIFGSLAIARILNHRVSTVVNINERSKSREGPIPLNYRQMCVHKYFVSVSNATKLEVNRMMDFSNPHSSVGKPVHMKQTPTVYYRVAYVIDYAL